MAKLKIDRDEEAQEGEIVESSWDLKKIGIGIVVLIFLFIVGSYFFKFMDNTLSQAKNIRVLGVSTASVASQNVPPLPTKKDIDSVIQNAKTTLSQITSDNVGASDSAIQKLIGDLQTLQGKKGALGAFCNLVCNNK